LKGVQAQVKEIRASLTPGLLGMGEFPGGKGEMLDAIELEKQVRRIESSVEELKGRREAAKKRVIDSAKKVIAGSEDEMMMPVIGSKSTVAV
jgi:hypothetical protein